MKKKVIRFFLYTITYHYIRVFLDFILPNAHVFNLIRGKVLGMYFKKSGSRFALASGCIINCPWNFIVEDDVYIAHNCWINAVGRLTIESGVIISPGVVLATTAHSRSQGKVSLRESNLAPIVIGEGSWVASNSVITKGVTIGEGAIVAANSVVINNIDRGTLYGGNPARLIKVL